MVFFRLPQGKIFSATIDMVAPVSNTPRYSRPHSRIRTQNTRSWAPPERPRQNSAGQVISNPLFRNLRAMLMKRLLFLALPSSPPSCSRLSPCSGWACVCERVVGPDCPQEGSEFPPWIRVGVASVLVRVLVVLVWLAVSASSSSTLTFVLPLSTSFRLVLAGVVAFACASTFARAFARILTLQVRRQALLVVALILVVLPLPTEGTGDSTPVVIRQLRLGAGLLLLLLPLDYEAVSLLAVRGVLQVALLVSGITPEELLDVFHDTGVFGGSPLSRSGSLVPFTMASRASTSRTVVVQVLVAFFL